MLDWRSSFAIEAAASYSSWLLETGSLTARCQNQSDSFKVSLLKAGPSPSMAMMTARPLPVWSREVSLECNGQPVIFARTEMPLSMHGRLSIWLKKLGERSLASLLFSGKPIRRGKTEYLRLDGRHGLFRRITQVADIPAHKFLWARRTFYFLGKQKILVTEVFLPRLILLQPKA